MLELIHYIHVTSGAIFVGAVIFFDWAIGVAMQGMTPAERKKLSLAVRKPAGLIVPGSLVLAVVAGVTRLFVSGAIQGWRDLFSGYGLMATLALVTIFVTEGFAGPIRKKMSQGLDEENDALFISSYKRQRLISLAMILVILFLMVSMRMGLY